MKFRIAIMAVLLAGLVVIPAGPAHAVSFSQRCDWRIQTQSWVTLTGILHENRARAFIAHPEHCGKAAVRVQYYESHNGVPVKVWSAWKWATNSTPNDVTINYPNIIRAEYTSQGPCFNPSAKTTKAALASSPGGTNCPYMYCKQSGACALISWNQKTTAGKRPDRD